MKQLNDMEPSPYYLGALARQQGKSPTDCPYPIGHERDAWMLGWGQDHGHPKALQSKLKPFFRLETKRFNTPSSLRLWFWGCVLRFALWAGHPVVLIGACRTGKTLLLEKLTPGKIIDKRQDAINGVRPLAITETDVPAGTYSLDECQLLEPNLISKLVAATIKQNHPFCLATQHYEVVSDALDAYRATEDSKRVLLVVVGGQTNPSVILRELPQ